MSDFRRRSPALRLCLRALQGDISAPPLVPFCRVLDGAEEHIRCKCFNQLPPLADDRQRQVLELVTMVIAASVVPILEIDRNQNGVSEHRELRKASRVGLVA
ncbi:MAG: hypothetical protein AAFY88_24695, partial [Acidobacteriota bacterium]